MHITIGRVSIDGEWIGPWLWMPFADCYFERDPMMQVRHDTVWNGSFGWLKWWVQVNIGKGE